MKVLSLLVLFYVFTCVCGSALYTACHADRVKFCPSLPPPYTEESLFESKCFQQHIDLLSTPCRAMMDNYFSLKSTPSEYSVSVAGGYGESVQTEIGAYPASYPPDLYNLTNSVYVVDAVYAPQTELEMQIQSICFADFQTYCPAEIPFYINYNDHSCIKQNLAHFSHRCHGIISSWLNGNSVYMMKYISLFLIPLSLFLCLTCVAGCCARLRRKRLNCRSRYQCRGRRNNNNNNTTNNEDLTEEELAFVFGDVPMQSETIIVPQYEQQNPSAPPQQQPPQQVVYLFPFQNTENPSNPMAFASPQFQFQPEVIFPAITNK